MHLFINFSHLAEIQPSNSCALSSVWCSAYLVLSIWVLRAQHSTFNTLVSIICHSFVCLCPSIRLSVHLSVWLADFLTVFVDKTNDANYQQCGLQLIWCIWHRRNHNLTHFSPVRRHTHTHTPTMIINCCQWANSAVMWPESRKNQLNCNALKH